MTYGFDAEWEPKEPFTLRMITVFSSHQGSGAVLRSPGDVKRWMHGHHDIRYGFFFFALRDADAFREWGCEVQPWLRGQQPCFTVTHGRTRFVLYDLHLLAQSFGCWSLKQMGELIGCPKYDKGALDLPSDHPDFIRYAVRDAEICARFADWVRNYTGFDPSMLASAGTLASQYFRPPTRFQHGFKDIPGREWMIRKYSFAGRSEAFYTGLLRDVKYYDVVSLYPVAALCSHALDIVGVEPCSASEINLSPRLGEYDYGWVSGVFESEDDLWGLPVRRLGRNYYVRGRVSGFYHTFDLRAANARVVRVRRCFRPVRSADDGLHRRFREAYLSRLSADRVRDIYLKAVLNALIGKLGARVPQPSRVANYPAYHTVLAAAHNMMSDLLHRVKQPFYMDTDSVFTDLELETDLGELDGIAHRLRLKAEGDCAVLAAKRYSFRNSPKHARLGWWYNPGAFYDAVWSDRDVYHVTKELRHTLFTREKAAQAMPLGCWVHAPRDLTREKVDLLLAADTKRVRQTYNSRELVREGRSIPSQSYLIRSDGVRQVG